MGVPSTERIEAATQQAEALRKAMLYIGEIHDDELEEHTPVGMTHLMSAIYTIRKWADTAEKGDYSEGTIRELITLHNLTVDCLRDPTEVDLEKLAYRYSKFYGIMASHLVKMMHREKHELKGKDDPTFG